MSLNNDLNQYDPTKLSTDTSSSHLQDAAGLEKIGTPKDMPPSGQIEKKTPTTNPSALEAKQTSGSIAGKLSKLLATLPTGEQVKNFFGSVLGGLANAGKALSQLASIATKNADAKTVLNQLFTQNEASKVETASQAPAKPPRPLLDAVKRGDISTVKELMKQNDSPEVQRDLNVARAVARNMPVETPSAIETRGAMLEALGTRELPPAPKTVSSSQQSTANTTSQAPAKPPRPLLDAVKLGDIAAVKELMKQKDSPGVQRDLNVARAVARNMPVETPSAIETRGAMLEALGTRELPPKPAFTFPQVQYEESEEVTVEDLPPPVPERDENLSTDESATPPPPSYEEQKSFSATDFYNDYANSKDASARTEMLRNLSPEQKASLKSEIHSRQETLSFLAKDELKTGSQDITFTVDLMTLAKNKVEIENTLRELEIQAESTVFKPSNTPPPTPTNSPSASPKARRDSTESLESVLGGAFTAAKSTPSPKSRLSQGPDSLSKQEKKELSAKLDELKNVHSQDELRTQLEAIKLPEQRKALLDKAIEDLTNLTLAKGTQAEKNTLSRLITNMGLLINPSGEFFTSRETVAQNLKVLSQIPITPLTNKNELLAARLLSKMSDAPAGFADIYLQQGSFSRDQLLLTYTDYCSTTELFNGMGAVLSANAPLDLQEASTNQKLAVLDFAKRWIATHENAVDNEALKTALLRGQESTDPQVKEAATNLQKMLLDTIASSKPTPQMTPSDSMTKEVQQSFDAVLNAATDSAAYKESVAAWSQDISRAIAGFKSSITANDLFVGSKNIDKNYGTANTTAAITRINLLTDQLNDLLVRAANPKEGGSPEKYIKARAFFLDMALQFEQANDLEALQAMQGAIKSSDSTALNNLYVKNSNSDAARNLDKKEAKYDETCNSLFDSAKNFKNLRTRSEERGVSLPLVKVMQDLFAIRNNNLFNSGEENIQIANTQVPQADLPNPTRIELSHDRAQAAISLQSKQQKLARESLETPLGQALKEASIQPRDTNQRYEVIKELKAAAKTNQNN